MEIVTVTTHVYLNKSETESVMRTAITTTVDRMEEIVSVLPVVTSSPLETVFVTPSA